MNNLPNLIIAGVSHSGTTSLFSYLSSHPEICASKIKETHYFYPIMAQEELTPIKNYQNYFTHCSNQKYSMESGPGYLYGGEKLARLIKEILGDVKLIFILREPVARLYSYFKYCNKALLVKNVSFDQFVNLLREQPLNPDFSDERKTKDRMAIGLESGFYAQHLSHWYHVFDDESIKVLFFDDLKENPSGLVNKVYQWLLLDACVPKDNEFAVENRGFYYKNRFIHGLAMTFNERLEPFFRKYPIVKQSLRKIYMLNAKENPFTIDDTTKNNLTKFYAPHNTKLYSLLRSKGYNDRLPAWLKVKG